MIAMALLILHIGDTKVWLSGWGLFAFMIVAGCAAKS